MANSNIIIRGFLGGDGEYKTSKSGIEFYTNTVAVNYKSNDGEYTPEWIKLFAIDKGVLGDFEEYYKGACVEIEGRFGLDIFTDKNGNSRKNITICVTGVRKYEFAKSKTAENEPKRTNRRKNP